ncbi:hypothetical protein [Halalkalibaculum sp. DA384]|uniref:hypothetical protein n=1 Tax=Halalkalibaculum sp. DA384 TaxID=3373606 RepID=UPI003754C897
MKNSTYKFPTFTPEEVRDRIRRMWDFSGPVPLPKFAPQCLVCGHDEILCKHWRFHIRKSRHSSSIYRCDVGMKCTACSAVWQHGLVVPEAMHPGKRRIIHWREVKRELASNSSTIINSK